MASEASIDVRIRVRRWVHALLWLLRPLKGHMPQWIGNLLYWLIRKCGVRCQIGKQGKWQA